jgi:hypothetical protein
MKLLLVTAASLFALVAACGSGDDATHGPSVTVDTGDAGSGGSCSSRASTAASAVSAAIKAADVTCTTDADCTQVVPSTECATVCATVTSLAGARTIASAVASANSSSCSNYTAGGCTATAPKTCPALTGAACVGGTCQAGSPTSWASITMFDRIPNSEMVMDPDAPCQAAETCTSWTVTPDGKVVVNTSTGDSVDQASSTLSDADLMTVNTLFSVSPAPESTLTCQAAPAGTTDAYLLEVLRGSSTSYTDVTGCIVTGPSLNIATQLYSVVKAY